MTTHCIFVILKTFRVQMKPVQSLYKINTFYLIIEYSKIILPLLTKQSMTYNCRIPF